MKLAIEIDGKTHEVDISERPEDPGTFLVTVDGRTYTARIGGEAPERRAPAAPASAGTREPSAAGGASVPPGGATVTAPMPGTIVSVNASAGDSVKKGQEIITMETMKMNVPIFAHRDGTLARINVREGDSVKAAEVLAEYET